MASKIHKIYKLKDGTEPCQKGAIDCMFANSTSGGCYAEWCIFDTLPAMEFTSKELTCSICNTNKTQISTYSGQTSYICPDCKKKLHKLIKEPKCSICGAKTEIGESICSSCVALIKEKINEPSS